MNARFEALSKRLEHGFAVLPEAVGLAEINAAVWAERPHKDPVQRLVSAVFIQ